VPAATSSGREVGSVRRGQGYQQQYPPSTSRSTPVM